MQQGKLKDSHEITMHPGWSAYFKSLVGQANILSIFEKLGGSGVKDGRVYISERTKQRKTSTEEGRHSQAKSIALSLVVSDPRLGQFIPSDILEEIDTPCTVKDVIALADLSGLKTDLGNDMLFTALAFLSHGVVKVESFYSAGTDQCDLSNTDAWALKRTASYWAREATCPLPIVNDKAWACAVADKYNLDMEIFYEKLCMNGGAGDGTECYNSFTVTLLGEFEIEDQYLGEAENLEYDQDEDEGN